MTQRTRVSIAEEHQDQLVHTVSALSAEPSAWIGPGLHHHVPSLEATKLVGDQPAGFLGY